MATAPTPEIVTMGLIEHLAELGIVQWRIAGDGSPEYTSDPTKPALYLNTIDETPVTGVAITLYDEDRSRDDHNPDFYFQLRGRAEGHGLVVDEMMQRLFEVLHWTDSHPSETWPNGAEIQMCRRVTRSIPLPAGSGVFERYDNYRITANPKG